MLTAKNVERMVADDENDFGFTAVDVTPDDVEKLDQRIQQTADFYSAEAEFYKSQLTKMHNAIKPLLTNLKKDPDKPSIYWPNRREKIEAFEYKLQEIESAKPPNTTK